MDDEISEIVREHGRNCEPNFSTELQQTSADFPRGGKHHSLRGKVDLPPPG